MMTTTTTTTMMMTTRLRLIFFFFIALLLLNAVTCSDDNDDETGNDGVYDYTFLGDVCSDGRTAAELTPGVNGRKKFGFVMPDSDGCYDALFGCQLLLNTSADHQLTIRFQELSTYCYEDVVSIKSDSNTSTTWDYCGFYAPSYSLYSSENTLIVQFVTGISVSLSQSCLTGFKLYYTAFHTGECSEDEFRCSFEGRCIPRELICDSYDNCGDWSDEKSGTCGLSTGSIIAISVMSSLIGLSFVVFIVYFIYDRTSKRKTTTRRHRRQNEDNRTTTTTNGRAPDGTIAAPNYDEAGEEAEAAPPPLYTYVNTVTAGIYDELEDFECDPNAPPSYSTVINNSNSSNSSNSSSNSSSGSSGGIQEV